MANLQRLIFVLLMLLGLSLSALAAETRISGLLVNGRSVASVDEACTKYAFNDYFTSQGAVYGGSWDWLSESGGSGAFAVCHGSGGSIWGSTFDINVEFTCDKGGTFSREKLGCYGEKPANACPAAGTNYLELMDGEDVPVGTKGLFCLDNCQMKVPGTVACVEVSGRWSCWAGGPGWVTYTGSECTGNESEMPSTGNEDPLPTDCKAGTCPGTVNGNAVCVPCGSGIDDGEGSGGEGSGGSGEGEGGTGSGTGTGEGEGGGSGTGGTGSGTGGGGVDGETGGDWGGDCKKGFVCEGDALICAISQAEHKRNCELLENPKESDEHKAYTDAIAAANRAAESGEGILADLTEEVDIKSGLINTTSALGSGSCIRDLSISVGGHAVSLPLSKICPYLAAFGNLLVAVSMLLAARIIMRG